MEKDTVGYGSFKGLEGSWRTVSEHYEKKIKDIARHHGWMDENVPKTVIRIGNYLSNYRLHKERHDYEKYIFSEVMCTRLMAGI